MQEMAQVHLMAFGWRRQIVVEMVLELLSQDRKNLGRILVSQIGETKVQISGMTRFIDIYMIIVLCLVNMGNPIMRSFDLNFS